MAKIDKVKIRFEKLMLSSVGMVVLDVLVGLLLLNYKSFSVKTTSIIVGSLLVLHGLFFMIRYLYDGLGENVFAVDLISSVASIILGVFAMFNIFDKVKAIGIIYGIFLVIAAIELGYFGLKFRNKQEEIYPLICFISILYIVMAVFVIVNPFKRFMLDYRLVGLFLTCYGLLSGLAVRLFYKRSEQVLDIFK